MNPSNKSNTIQLKDCLVLRGGNFELDQTKILLQEELGINPQLKFTPIVPT